MVITFYIIYFFVGAVFASFLEVVRTRGLWRFSLNDRSTCISCSHSLRWYELIPVISFLLQLGKCRKCFKKIPFSNFIAEVLTGTLVLLSFIFTTTIIDFIGLSIIFIFLVPLILQDIESYDVPENIVYPLIFFISIWAIIFTPFSFVYAIALALPFFLLWLFSNGKAMGLGDTFVAFPIGLTLSSFIDVVFVFFGTFVIGLILVIIYWVYKMGTISIKRGMHVPLIPSMAIAYSIVIFNPKFICFLYPTICSII